MKKNLPQTTQTRTFGTHTNLLFGIIALFAIGVIAVSCVNPFFPEKAEKEKHMINNNNNISVTIAPDVSYIFSGDTVQFSATVENSNDQNVTWSKTGNNHSDTKIDSNGVLTISADETPNAQITIKAVSTADKSKKSEITVTVISFDDLEDILVISGENKTGETLKVNTDDIADGGGEFEYKWKVGGEEVEGENGSSYTVKDEDEGEEITCEVTYKKEDGTEITVVITLPGKTVYSIVIDFHDKEEGDTITAEPQSGKEGTVITLSYNVIDNNTHYNRLHFSGTNEKIDDVTAAGNGTRKYIIDPEDALDGVITIIATFTHTDLIIDEISFTENAPIINKTYGDAPFTNAVKPGHMGTGAITYSSEDETVATVNNSGTVTIHKAGGTVITAEKAADAVYAHSSVSYKLMSFDKTITITGITAVDRDYIAGNTTVALTTSGFTVVGVINNDNVGFRLGNGTMANANAGNNKPVTTAITLTGSDAGNYSLNQPVVTVTINKIDPVVVWSTGLMAIVNSPIGNIPLPGNGTGTPGTFSWVSPNTLAGAAGTRWHNMRFTPNDTTNYNTLTRNVNIWVRTVGEDIAANMEEIVGGTSRSFQMGQCASGNNVTPVHTVTLTQRFSMSKYQVTQEQYMAVMGNNPSYRHGGTGREPAEGEIQGKRPVERVSWYNAIVFCNRLSILEGLTPAYSISGSTNPDAWGTVPTSSNATWNAIIIVAGSTGYRLPTEAQWEYAAKGGHLSNNYIYAGSNDVDEVAWYTDNSGWITHQVGLKKPNELGLYDMSGNVQEWCWDWEGAYTADAKIDPMGASKGLYNVPILRGWSFIDSATRVRSVSRGYNNSPGNGRDDIGFRVVRP